jgi:hypothetical protein
VATKSSQQPFQQQYQYPQMAMITTSHSSTDFLNFLPAAQPEQLLRYPLERHTLIPSSPTSAVLRLPEIIN